MDPKKPPIQNDIQDLILVKLADIERVMNIRIQQAEKHGGSTTDDMQMMHELLAKVVKSIDDVKTQSAEKSDKEMITLLEQLVAEVKKKEEYDYEIEIDDSLREKLRGRKGEPGTPGTTPKKGVDYLTTEEITTFKNDVAFEVKNSIQDKLDKILGKDNNTDVESRVAEMLKTQTTDFESRLKKEIDTMYEQVQEYSMKKGGGGSLQISAMKDIDFKGMQDGYVLKYSASRKGYYFAAASGGGTPGGSDKQIQFNDAGAFGGNAGLTFDKVTNTFKAGTEMFTVQPSYFVAGDPLGLSVGSYFDFSLGSNLYTFWGASGYRATQIDLSTFTAIVGDPDGLVGGFYTETNPVGSYFNIGVGIGGGSLDPYVSFELGRMVYTKDYNMSFGGDVGTIIAENSDQKFAFWGAQPIIRPDGSLTPSNHNFVGGTPVLDGDTFDIGGTKYTILQLFTLIFELGLWRP